MFDAGSIVGKLELGLEGWKKSVEAVKADQQSMSGFAIRHGEEIEKLGKRFVVAGAAITAALTAIVLSTAKAGDEFDEMAAKTGISTEVLSTLKLAADKSGTSIESVAAGMKFLATQMLETASATDKSKTVLGALGISATDASGKLRPMNEVLFDVADKFKGMEAGALKTKLAVAIFGKAGMDMIPILDLGRDGLMANEVAARRLGSEWSGASAKAAVIFADAMVDLKAAGTGLSKTIGESLMPVVKEFIEHATETVVKIKDWAKENPALTKGILEFAGGLGIALTVVGTMMVALGQLVKTCTLLRITVATPIIITVGIAGGVALAKTLEEIREFYEKNISHRYIAQEDRDWQGLIRTMGEWTTIAGEIAEGYQKQNKYSHESHAIIGQLDDIWQKYGNSSRQAIEAILKGEAGPAVRELLIKIMEAHGGAAQLAGVHAKAEGEVKKAAVALDPALQALLDALDKGKSATKTMAEKLADLAKETLVTHPAIAKLEKAVMDAAKSGKILASDLKPTVDRLIELKIQAKEGVSPALYLMSQNVGAAFVALDKLSGGSAVLRLGLLALGINFHEISTRVSEMVIPSIDKFATALTIIAGIVKSLNNAASTLGVTLKTDLKKAFDAAVASFNILNDAGQLTTVTANEAANKIAEMARVLGVTLPANIKKASGTICDFKEELKRMFVEMAQGWSAAVVSMLGITKTLLGEATKHNQAFYDQCRKDLDRDYEFSKSIIDQKLSDLDDFYSEAMDELRKSYAEQEDQVNKSYDDQMDIIGKYYDDLMDKARESFDLLAKQEDDAYDARELKYRRQEEDDDIRYSRQYDRDREAIKNSEMTEEQKNAALLALEIAYENAKLVRDRAREDAKLAREKVHEAELAKIAKDRDIYLEGLALAREAREKAAELEKEARLKQLDLEREAREKLLDLEKEARQKALQLELLALAAKHEADLEAIRKADEQSQKDADQRQLDRQNSLWGKIKTVFGDAVEAMLTTWLTSMVTPFLASITEKLLPKITEIGTTTTNTGTTIGNVFEGIGRGIEDIVGSITRVIELIAKTVVDIVAYAITTLADAIATAAASLAAAAPDLLIVGATAAAIYGMFKVVGLQAETLADIITGIFGVGASASTENNIAFMKLALDAIRDTLIIDIRDNQLNEMIWWDEELGRILTVICQKLDNIANLITIKIDNLAAIMNTSGFWNLFVDNKNQIVAAIEGQGRNVITAIQGISLGNVTGRIGDLIGTIESIGIGSYLDWIGRRIGDVVDAIHAIPSHQSGGYVAETGLAFLHAGEYVIPPQQIAMDRGGSQPAGPTSIGGNTTVHIHGPFVSTSGAISRSDIKKAGEEIFEEIKFQANRHAMRFAHA